METAKTNIDKQPLIPVELNITANLSLFLAVKLLGAEGTYLSMTTDPNNTPDPTTTAPAVYVDKLSFRYGSLDDDYQPKRTAAAPAAAPPEQANAIEDISFSLPAGKLM